MIDRDSPVTDDELHAYVDGELPADRKAPSRPGSPPIPRMPRGSPNGARRPRRSARATARSPRAGAGALRPRPARARTRAAVARHRRGGRRRVPRRRRRRLDGARRLGGGAQRRSRSSPPKRSARTGSTSREVRHPIEVRAAEQHLMPWLSRRVGTNLRAPDLEDVLAQAARRAAAARPDRPGGAVHVREPDRRALHASIARSSKAPRTALRYQARRRGRGRALGRERDRLRGERAGRPRPAVARSRRPPTSRWKTRRRASDGAAADVEARVVATTHAGPPN